jgi:hypothetical protein
MKYSGNEDDDHYIISVTGDSFKDKHENDREIWLKLDPIFDC